MRPQSSSAKSTLGERLVKDIRRATRRQFSAEEKIRIVLDGLRVEGLIAKLCRREGIAQPLPHGNPDYLRITLVSDVIGI